MINLYDATVPVFTKLLRQIDGWLERLVAYADQKQFDPEVLLGARLAPTQYSLLRQIQAALDQAKFTCAKLCGKQAPSHPDTEKTVPELRARVRSVLDYLGTFTREDFAGAEERPCGHMWMEGKMLRGGDYLDHFALPNFHFHMSHAYAILRHNGLELVKNDYVGALPYLA